MVGCGFGQSGIEPPADRMFFPAGIAVDPGGRWLYVVNSNSDLRFNAGTVVAVDLDRAAEDRLPKPAANNGADWGRCPNSFFADPPAGVSRFCCRDYIDGNVLNCDERGYVAAGATVSIGSFGGTLLVQALDRPGQPPRRRLFAAVRAEPSLTFVDVTLASDGIKLRCTPEEGARPNAYCQDGWRISGAKADEVTKLQFQEEPHAMLLDEALGLLYVGHLGGIDRGRLVARGISVIDVCDGDTRPPRLASILPLALPGSGTIGVTSMTQALPGRADLPLYATAELSSDIAELVHRTPGKIGCAVPEAERDLTLVAGRGFQSSAFGTRGADLRGLVLFEEQARAYVLHRQFAVRGEFNPASVVAIDRRLDERGRPTNQPTGIVEVCNGPNRILPHDAGRGMRLFVNCFEGGQIYVIEPNLLNVEAVIEVGAGPAELVFAPNQKHRAFVAGFANNNVSIIDLEPGSSTEYRVIQRIGFVRSRVVQQ